MRAVPVRAVLLGVAFAVILGASFSFLTSPWSMADLTLEIVMPIVVGAAVGFAFGLVAAWKPRLAWVIWPLTVPAMAGVIWAGVERCQATTPGDDCSIAWIIVFGWLVPWSIGTVVLGTSSVVTFWRRRRASSAHEAPGSWSRGRV